MMGMEAMSTLGHKQTSALQEGVSALPPKADMCGATMDVRYGPEADISALIRSPRQRAPEAKLIS